MIFAQPPAGQKAVGREDGDAFAACCKLIHKFTRFCLEIPPLNF